MLARDDVRAAFKSSLVRQYHPVRIGCSPAGSEYDFPMFVRETAAYLEKRFGVRDLSLIERGYLLRCCERAGALYVEQLGLYQRDEEFSKHLIYPQKEAAWYWLMDALDLEIPVILRNLNREAKTLDVSEATPDASEAAPDNWEATPEFNGSLHS